MSGRGRWNHILDDAYFGGSIDDIIESLKSVKERFHGINVHVESDMDNCLYFIDYDKKVSAEKKFYSEENKRAKIEKEKSERALLKKLKDKYER